MYNSLIPLYLISLEVDRIVIVEIINVKHPNRAESSVTRLKIINFIVDTVSAKYI